MDLTALAEAADDNLVAHTTASTRLIAGSRIDAAPDLVLVDSGLPCDTFNFVSRARLDATTARRRIDDALRFFDRSGHPFSWWHGPGATPDSLADCLTAAGLQASESERVMALELARLPEFTPPPGLEIRRVRTWEELAVFAELSAANWSPPDQWVVRYYQLAGEILLGPAATQWLYLGWFEGRPVATAELTLSGITAGLYNIATVPAMRGRGIGTAMTREPLREGTRAGCRWAILQASDAGVPVYRNIGFREIGVMIEFKPGK